MVSLLMVKLSLFKIAHVIVEVDAPPISTTEVCSSEFNLGV